MTFKSQDCFEDGKLIGIKSLVNEFVAYAKLKELTDGDMISERSKTIAYCSVSSVKKQFSFGLEFDFF